MNRTAIATVLFLIFVGTLELQGYNFVVADSTTRRPLPNASVYDRNGAPIGICDQKGILPHIAIGSYPITVRYLGFVDRTVASATPDTIFLQEDISELPEFVVKTRKHKVLHMLAYVREYSMLSTYTDTVFLFREKMVDYMLGIDRKVKFKGWILPRVLTVVLITDLRTAQDSTVSAMRAHTIFRGQTGWAWPLQLFCRRY